MRTSTYLKQRISRDRLEEAAQRLFGVPFGRLTANDALRVVKSLKGQHPSPDTDPDGFFYTDPATGERMEP